MSCYICVWYSILVNGGFKKFLCTLLSGNVHWCEIVTVPNGRVCPIGEEVSNHLTLIT